jgi:hypothetical protein
METIIITMTMVTMETNEGLCTTVALAGLMPSLLLSEVTMASKKQTKTNKNSRPINSCVYFSLTSLITMTMEARCAFEYFWFSRIATQAIVAYQAN